MLQLTGGNTYTVTLTITTGSAQIDVAGINVDPGSGNLAVGTQSFSFTAPASGQISFVNASGNNAELQFGSVSLTAAAAQTPEPSTTAGLIALMLGCCVVERRRILKAILPRLGIRN